MDFAGNPSALKEAISSGTGKSGEEVERLIEAKRQKFSGLLTEAGAAFMIAKELGVKTVQAVSEATKISSLKEGMNNVDVVGRVRKVFPKKEFEKNGRKGKLQSVIIWDGSAEARATLWNDDIEKFAQKPIAKGSAVKISNCSVSSYNGAVQLNLNYNSSLEQAEGNGLPELESKFFELNDLDAGMASVDVKVLIKKVFPAKNFETEKGSGKVMNFIIAQGVEELRATAWNSQCDAVEEIGEGEKVVIEDAYTKQGRDGIELHLGQYARIIKENKI